MAKPDWIKINPTAGSNNGSFNVVVDENAGASRNGIITVTGEGLSKTVDVHQAKKYNWLASWKMTTSDGITQYDLIKTSIHDDGNYVMFASIINRSNLNDVLLIRLVTAETLSISSSSSVSVQDDTGMLQKVAFDYFESKKMIEYTIPNEWVGYLKEGMASYVYISIKDSNGNTYAIDITFQIKD